MEKYILEKDIKVFCVTAKSFPEGVMEAHQTLHSKLPANGNRKFFGISSPIETGTIIYKAAAEELPGDEFHKFDFETFIIRRGEYISEYIPNFMDDVQIIAKTFKELIAYPHIDPKGYCLEMYLNDKDLRCMVRIIS